MKTYRREQEESRQPDHLNFHYNREERLAGASDAVRRRGEKQGFFRRFRASILILLNVLVLIGMVALYTAIRGDDTQAMLPGYAVVLRAVQFGEQALVTVTIRQTTDAPALAGSIVQVDMRVAGTTLARTVKDVLTVRKGDVRTFRAVLEPLPTHITSVGNGTGTVDVAVQAGTASVHLSMKMKSE
ncbi:MAG TPA: hypothetical protein VMW73_07755 [Spirochaetia bacterium]|nr:hypothetical protein [Spirochaetia bacterium]